MNEIQRKRLSYGLATLTGGLNFITGIQIESKLISLLGVGLAIVGSVMLLRTYVESTHA